MSRSRRAASTPCCSRKSSSSDDLSSWPRTKTRSIRTPSPPNGAWRSTRRRDAPGGADGGRRRRAGAAHGRPMGGDGRGRRTVRPGRQGRRRAHPQSGGNRQPARLQPRRHLAQRQFRHPRDHRFGDGLLRAPADAGNRLRPAGPVDDDEPAQFHLRQRRSLARPHHLGAFRRLSQFDSAAGDPGGVQGRGMGQFRPVHGRFQPDLFDDRRAARRPARPDARSASRAVPTPRSNPISSSA